MKIKIFLTTYVDHFEVAVKESGINLHVFTFTTKEEAQSFIRGFHCAKTVINGLVQSLPLNYETRKA